MNNRFLSLVIIAAALSVPHLAAEPEQRVAVVEFDVKGNVAIKDAGTIIAEWMSTAAAKTGEFTLYERILLKKVLEEQKLGATGLINEETASKMGELYGVEAIISGSIIEWQGIHTISARLMDTETGRILSTADYKTKDVTTMASIMDKMAMVLSGTISQEILDRESLSIAGDKKIQTPFSIIKVFRRNGVLKAAINKGINDNIKKNTAFAIYMPKYEESIVTGQKTVVGKRKVGDLVITQVEPSISSGNLYVGPGLANDPALLEQEAIAVPYIFAMGIGGGITNIGAHVSMLFRFPKHVTLAEFSYTWPLFGYGSGLLISSGTLFNLIGSYASPFNLKIGGNYLSYFVEMDATDLGMGAMILGVMPLAEIGLFKLFYIRAGALLGFDMDVDFRFAVVPILQAGVSFFFERRD